MISCRLAAAGLRRSVSRILFLLLCWPLLHSAAHAQEGGAVEGSVVSTETHEALPGVNVHLAGTTRGTITDAAGHYRLPDVPPGDYVLEARFVGYTPYQSPIVVAAGEVVRHDLSLTEGLLPLQDVVVTATQERQAKAEIAATIATVDRSTLAEAKPTHPSDILGRLAGVWVNNTSGEGHMTAIRQPLTTDPVYLYLEDGVPTRSTGFFNHNALYEINLPGAESIEVIKGPGTALYGSDAIGGVINVTTRRPPLSPTVGVAAEGGSYGFGRLLLSGGTTVGRSGFRADANLTRSDGWRSATNYDRQSATLRWDLRLAGNARLKTVVAFSNIDQEPAGSSALSEDDFFGDATLNYTPVSFRKVQAYRLSSAYERFTARTLLSLTPYVRYNTMEILPNWSLTYDPAVWDTKNASAGVLAKYRRDFEPLRARLIVGADLDYSPGSEFEQQVLPQREGKVFTEYDLGDALYDYDVTFREASPYVHGEISPTDRLRLNGGLRLDVLGYAYTNNLDVVTTGPHKRPADADVSYTHLSPKLGATYRVSDALNVFAAYAHAFRVPSQGQLFRSGPTDDTVDLAPVKADNLEMGLRGQFGPGLDVELSAYSLIKTDDIVAFVNDDGTRESLNAGKTWHRGLEATVTAAPLEALRLDASFSLARHTYERWQPQPDLDFGGNEMEAAPNVMGSVGATLRPAFLRGSSVTLEWRRLGAFWMDAANTNKYEGHDLFNLQATVPLLHPFDLFARVNNLTDRRYAETASYTAFRGRELAPGLPRTFYLGLQYNWQ